ncbi:hypothetical protein N7475_008811 [Penicillium sp. IBT 31633x]|nr:hypothetical protein N7475_008811 [Penicillium sp. IBT 31633x]
MALLTLHIAQEVLGYRQLSSSVTERAVSISKKLLGLQDMAKRNPKGNLMEPCKIMQIQGWKFRRIFSSKHSGLPQDCAFAVAWLPLVRAITDPSTNQSLTGNIAI